MLKKNKISILLFWTLFVFFLIATPLPEYDGTIEKLYDKVAHLFFFGIFSGLLALILLETKLKRYEIFFVSFSAGIVYSALCEVVQIYVPGRDVSDLDFIAGIIGAFIFSFLGYILSWFRKPRLLLHICCVGCGVYVSQVLKKRYKVILYYFNPNIFPEAEHDKRLDEAKRIAKKFKLELIIGKYEYPAWLKAVKGHENDPEKGERCLICYRERLRSAVKMAKRVNCKFFTTTLTTSPHKLAPEISKIGHELELEYKVKFFDQDFKKQDGFKKSSQLSRDLNLYRQDYCGCEYSMRKD